MNKYNVKVNPRAIHELDCIYEYIANEKLALENAKGQDDQIKKAILSLDTFPQSHQERNEGRYAGKGYRQLLINNTVSGTESIKKAPNDATNHLVLSLSQKLFTIILTNSPHQSTFA